MRINRVNALITGASAGIGCEFARQLASHARSLILVARREQRLNELRDELIRSHPSLVIHVRKTDLADLSQVEELAAWLEREKLDVELLINNAGLGDVGPFATSDPTRNEQMILVNVLALTSLTRKLLPEMILRKNAAIVNVSSSAGFLPVPEFAVYAATKAYVTSFSEALRAELRGSRVSVTTVCPGPVRTEFQEVAKRSGGRPDSAPELVYVSVEKVVRDGLAAIEADRPVVIPGFAMKLGMLLVRLTPMPVLRVAWQAKTKRA